MRRAFLALLLCVGLTDLAPRALAQDATPPTDPPPPMPKPKAKKKPTGPAVPTGDTCKTDFEGEPVAKEKRKPKPAARIVKDAEDSLDQASKAPDPNSKLTALKAAQDALFDALKKDPYSAMATERLAEVYARAGRKKCAKALLERVSALKDFKDVLYDAKRAINAAKQSDAFDAMRADADRALQ